MTAPSSATHTTRLIRGVLFLFVIMSTVNIGRADAQMGDSTRNGDDRRFLRPRELAVLGAGLAAAGALSLADVRIARWDQSAGVQGGSGRARFFKDVTKVNETTITVAGLAAYGIGRVFHAEAFTDVAKHTTEAVVFTSLVSQAIRGPLGRTRPYVTRDSNQYDFHFGKGFTSFDNRAWPSLHSATAFAAGSALVAELGERHPGAMPWAAPLIYAAAAMPGLSRMYLDQHWASDVLAGDVLGAVLGARLVHYAHSAPTGALPRWLANVTVVPIASGGMALAVTVPQ